MKIILCIHVLSSPRDILFGDFLSAISTPIVNFITPKCKSLFSYSAKWFIYNSHIIQKTDEKLKIMQLNNTSRMWKWENGEGEKGWTVVKFTHCFGKGEGGGGMSLPSTSITEDQCHWADSWGSSFSARYTHTHIHTTSLVGNIGWTGTMTDSPQQALKTNHKKMVGDRKHKVVSHSEKGITKSKPPRKENRK